MRTIPTWGWWLILDSLWYYLLKWLLFCGFHILVLGCHILILHRFFYCILACICGGWNIWCQFLYVFFIPVTGAKFHCTLSLSILVHPFFIGPCTPKNHFSLTLDVVFCWFQFDFIFLGVYAYIVFCASVKLIFVVGSIGNTEGVFFNVVIWWIICVIDRVIYLCALILSALVTF